MSKEYKSVFEKISLPGFNTYISIPDEAMMVLNPEKNKLKKTLKKRRVTDTKESMMAMYSMLRYIFETSNIVMIVNHFFKFGNVLLILP